jgi:hypothetical protein
MVVSSMPADTQQTRQTCVSLVEQMLTATTPESEDSLVLEILDLFLEIALRMGKALAPYAAPYMLLCARACVCVCEGCTRVALAVCALCYIDLLLP